MPSALRSCPLNPERERIINSLKVRMQQLMERGLPDDLSGGLLVRGNSKLGGRIWCFSLPPVLTCKCATGTCLEHCYAMNYISRWSHALVLYVRNYQLSRRSNFVQLISEELQRQRVKILRLHVAGEFYGIPYIRRWLRIVESHPEVTFYCYTRAWRLPSFHPFLVELARLPNMHLWYSFDRDCRCPPRSKHIRYAYMAVDNHDLPPKRTDLVFRVRDRRIKATRLDGHLVCPVENGHHSSHNVIGCSTCEICFKTAWKRSL